jgi:hypothetical protein
MPKTQWPDYAENELAGLRRKPNGLLMVETNWPDYGGK